MSDNDDGDGYDTRKKMERGDSMLNWIHYEFPCSSRTNFIMGSRALSIAPMFEGLYGIVIYDVARFLFFLFWIF